MIVKQLIFISLLHHTESSLWRNWLEKMVKLIFMIFNQYRQEETTGKSFTVIIKIKILSHRISRTRIYLVKRII